jgi:hypothetical protein
MSRKIVRRLNERLDFDVEVFFPSGDKRAFNLPPPEGYASYASIDIDENFIRALVVLVPATLSPTVVYDQFIFILSHFYPPLSKTLFSRLRLSSSQTLPSLASAHQNWSIPRG